VIVDVGIDANRAGALDFDPLEGLAVTDDEHLVRVR
jgi:hypothetical protein